MVKTYDEVTGIATYQDKTSPKYVNDNGFFLFISQKENEQPVLAARLLYNGEDWVFIKKYIIKADEQSFEIPPSYSEVKRDHQAGEVWEYYTAIVDKKLYEIVNAIMSSKKTIIRHQGDDKRHDRTVTDKEKAAFQNVLDAFKAMGGNDIQFTL